MEKTVTIILEGDFSEETQKQINEFLAYAISLNEVEKVATIGIGGGGFINHKPRG
jgi:hypothetical protein